MVVGKNVVRVDAYEKVTGRAKYTADLCPPDALVAKVLHSTISNGIVRSIDTSEAEKVPGVVKIVTCFDVPDSQYPTAGHPWSTDPAHQDIRDRKILNRRIRYFGDDVAAVVAKDEVAAQRALECIHVEYEEFEPLLTTQQATAAEAGDLHEEFPGNVLNVGEYEHGDFEAAVAEPGLIEVEGDYDTQMVQHCHLENAVSCAWMEKGRVVIMTSTQIPQIVRRCVGQALNIPWGKVRVLKPYVGGGFGNKQDVLYEPLNAFLTMQVGGRCVRLELTREETFRNTRCRHAVHFHIKSWFRPDGTLVAQDFSALSGVGGYASHGHAVVGNTMGGFRNQYQEEKALREKSVTIYTSQPTAGAMRGYGIPQVIFAAECHMEEAAAKLKLDPIQLRMKNMMRKGYVDPPTGITCNTDGLVECIQKGKEFIGWDEKRAKYANQTGNIRRGVGMAIFTYKTGVYPKMWEGAGARLILNQDGSVQLQVGATEIGQGADTVFTQMAAETLGVSPDDIHLVSMQDTDVTPFDTGAFSSRQSYVTGSAVRQNAAMLKEKILAYASKMLQIPAHELDLQNSEIVRKDGAGKLLTLEDVAMEALYSIEDGVHLTAESTFRCNTNAFSLGACFAEVEVDIALCKVRVLNIVDVHDCGRVINPSMAAGQVHGGMSMAIGYALSEEFLFDKRGKLLNGTLLDYKMPTSMDVPDLGAEFVDTVEPTGPYGNKSLGEPPAIPGAPAIRNAVYNATGVSINRLPMSPPHLYEAFVKAGLI